MKKEIVKVSRGDFVAINSQNQVSMLYAVDLNDAISFKFVIKGLGCAGLANAIEVSKLNEIFNAYNLDKNTGKIEVNITGGDSSEKSVKYLEDLLLGFKEIDNERQIFEINVKANDDLHSNFCCLNVEEECSFEYHM